MSQGALSSPTSSVLSVGEYRHPTACAHLTSLRYGGPRVLDLFVISNTVPKRIKHVDGQAASLPATTSFTERRKIEPSFAEGIDHTSGVRLSEPEEVPVEQTMEARFLWALDLLTAMRGCGCASPF